MTPEKHDLRFKTGIVAVFAVSVFLSYASDAYFPAVKELARALFLFPVLVSAYAWGKRGGIISSLFSIAACAIIFARTVNPADVSPQTAELASGSFILFFLGAFFGVLFDADRAATQALSLFVSLKDDFSAEEARRYGKELFRKKPQLAHMMEERIEAVLHKKKLSDDASAARKNFQELLDALPAGVFLMDEGHGILFANAIMRRDFPEEQNGSFAVSRENLISEMKKEAVKTGECVYCEHLFNYYGHERLYGIYGQNVTAAAGLLTDDAVLFIFEDVTHRRKLLTLHETDALREDFYSGISHDMKNPVSAICGYMSEAASRMSGRTHEADSVSDAQIFGGIEDCAGRAKRLASDLLDVAQLEAGKPFELNKEHVSVVPAAQKVVNTLKPFCPAHAFEIHADDACHTVIFADEKRLEQILFNLLENAVKYSPRGGKVSVEVKETQGEVMVCVKDEGIGIPAAEIKNIFSKFYRVRDEHTRRIHGTGFGLYLVKSLVELHGGSIRAESLPGNGSSFWLVFPNAEQ